MTISITAEGFVVLLIAIVVSTYVLQSLPKLTLAPLVPPILRGSRVRITYCSCSLPVKELEALGARRRFWYDSPDRSGYRTHYARFLRPQLSIWTHYCRCLQRHLLRFAHLCGSR
jgi:hypothetical protein